MADILVVNSKVKEFVKPKSCSGDFSEVLSKKVEALIKDAMARADSNGRQTVMSRDL